MASRNIFRSVLNQNINKSPFLSFNQHNKIVTSNTSFLSLSYGSKANPQNNKFAPHAKHPQHSFFSTNQSNFKQVRDDLRNLLSKEIDDIFIKSEQEEAFLSSKNFKFEALDNVKRQLTRSVDGYTVDVTFDVPESLDLSDSETEHHDDENIEESVNEEESAPAEGEQAATNSFIKLKVVVKKSEAASDLHAQCVIGEDRRFYIETIQTSEGPNPVWIADLSDEVQGRLYDFFDHLGLDDNFAEFAIVHTENQLASNAIGVLKNFSQFLN
eukprot:TRINITY_DN15497_c0_g1_i1.p1 TRINITY_DN15497_c0_g1~~TRINITY_DN15497_c0_g1_i1.p1  ORF type:complete len:270 (-),score=82.91 TRINITY_DN15497_c0_g1_i1:81-890(-)